MKYIVVYLKHSLFADAQKVITTMTQGELAQLLDNGMITVMSAQILE